MSEDNQKTEVPKQFRNFRKNLLFSAIIIIVFFAGLELVLAFVGVRPVLLTEDPWVGFAENVPQFVEHTQADGSIVLKTAKNKRIMFNEQSFPKNKSGNTYRIFCMGGSTTYGRPYVDRVSFCGWLRAYLQAADPTRNWEVINAGGVSFASYRVAKLMNELKGYQPDLFIVYSGQNEFLEERSYGALMNLPPWMIQLDSTLSATRTYTAMKNLIDKVKPSSPEHTKERTQLSGEVDEILNHTVGPESYQRDDKLKRQIINHFRFNLRRMVHIAKEVDAKILFIQPAINLKGMSPFKSEHKAGLSETNLKTWQAHVARAAELDAAGKFGEALPVYREALAIDDRYADLHFRIGHVLFALGQYDEAEASFWRAVDEDIAPLRILSEMQGIIKEVANWADAPLIDFPQILRTAYLSKYNHAVFGEEFFPDHVHTNIEGYRLLGLALMDHFIARGLAHPSSSWNIERIEAVNHEVIAGLDPKIEGYALRNLGKVLAWAGKFEEANRAFLRALDILGPDPLIYERLVKSAIARGKLDEAIHYLSETAIHDPNQSDLHRKIGALLIQQGKTDEAIDQYKKEITLFPKNAVAHTELAILWEAKGDEAKALAHYEAALAILPYFEFARLNLALFFARTGHYEEALIQSQEVLRINPRQHLAYNTMGLVLKNQGRFAQAADQFREVLRLRPDFDDARKNLQEVESKLNQQKAH